jgi:hypothetical protein
MSAVQFGVQVSLTPRFRLFVWQVAIQALTSQLIAGNGETTGSGAGVGGAMGPAAGDGAKEHRGEKRQRKAQATMRQ